MASGNQNECSMATARSNCVCASALHEVAKCTSPSLSASVVCAWAVTPTALRNTMRVMPVNSVRYFMLYLPVSRGENPLCVCRLCYPINRSSMTTELSRAVPRGSHGENGGGGIHLRDHPACTLTYVA